MKILSTILFSIIAAGVFAQGAQVTFHKNNGLQVASSKDADYSVVVKAPESGSSFYKVSEFYINGTPKGAGEASSIKPFKYEGVYTNYYPNGNKKSVLNYNSNILKGRQAYYYSNGKLNEVRVYPEASVQSSIASTSQYLIESFNDSTGTPLVTGGNGYYKYATTGKIKTVTEGPVKQGLKDGEWKITVGKDSILATEVYSGGTFVRGTSKFANGESYTYDKPDRKPEFEGGTKAFYQFLSKTLRYPSVAQQKEKQGRVNVSFVVEKDGTLTDIKVLGSVPDESLATEAIRVISASPPWLPGIQYGRAVSTKYTTPIVFTLSK